MSNLASNISTQGNKTSGGTSPQQTKGSSSGNINNQTTSTTNIQDFINKNNENFKKISTTAEKYFNEQKQKFDRDKIIEKFPNLDNFYNQITVKPKTQTDLKLSSNKLVDIINFQNFGNLSLESMKDIDRDSDPICKFANQIFEIKRAKKEATKQVTNTNPAQTSLIQNMEKSIQTIAKNDPKYSTTDSMNFARYLYTGDVTLRTLNALEGYLISNDVKTAGYTYTPKSIINNHIEIVKLAILDNNTNDLSEEQKKKREETFKILYDVLSLQNIESKTIVAYISDIESIAAFTEYCQNQSQPLDFSSILTANQKIVSGISKLTNQPQQNTPGTTPPTGSNSASTTSKTADQIKDEIKTKIEQIVNHPEFNNENMLSGASAYERNDDTKLTNRLSTQNNLVAPEQIDQIQNDDLKQLAKDVNDLISQYRTAITSAPQGQAPQGQAPQQQQTQNSALQNNQQQNAAGNSRTASNTTINVPNDFVPKLKDAIKKDIQSKNQGQYNEFKKALSQATGLKERIFNVNNDNDFYQQKDVKRAFLNKAKNIIKLREQKNLWTNSQFYNTQNYLNSII